MADTKSEVIFATYCNDLNIESYRIEEDVDKRPDYRLEKSNLICIAEVKEFIANKDEKKAIDSLKINGITTRYGCKPGQRVRKKIKSAVPQLKQLTNGKYPGILVLYYNVPELLGDGCTDPYHILTAMYGLQTVTTIVGNNRTYPDKFGSDRKTTPKDNTTLSAILVIRDYTGEITSSLYHNLHAAIPLPIDFFNHISCTQYVLENHDNNEFKQFNLVSINNS